MSREQPGVVDMLWAHVDTWVDWFGVVCRQGVASFSVGLFFVEGVYVYVCSVCPESFGHLKQPSVNAVCSVSPRIPSSRVTGGRS